MSRLIYLIRYRFRLFQLGFPHTFSLRMVLNYPEPDGIISKRDPIEDAEGEWEEWY
jgi:hypothetical protein